MLLDDGVRLNSRVQLLLVCLDVGTDDREGNVLDLQGWSIRPSPLRVERDVQRRRAHHRHRCNPVKSHSREIGRLHLLELVVAEGHGIVA